jgi:hypothetical protein
MIADFTPTIRAHGAWWYRRLFWESGVLGQVLYLEAEAAGVRSTGIGCYFDDAFHELLGLKGEEFQDLYHFTVGGAIEDHRLLSARQDVLGREGVGQRLRAVRIRTVPEGIAALLKADPFFTQPTRQPFMAVDADAAVEGKVRTDANEHPAEVAILEVEVVLPNEAIEQFDVVALLGKTDCDACVLTALEDHTDTRLAVQVLEKRFHPIFATNLFGRFDNLDLAFRREGLHRLMIFGRDGTEVSRRQGSCLPLVFEEADNAGRILKHLNDGIEENTIKAGVAETDAVLMV